MAESELRLVQISVVHTIAAKHTQFLIGTRHRANHAASFDGKHVELIVWDEHDIDTLKVNVSALRDDVADAFESFKLAIIAHRRERWRDTTPESICECLEALKSLALAE